MSERITVTKNTVAIGSAVYRKNNDGWRVEVYDGLAYGPKPRVGQCSEHLCIMLDEIMRLTYPTNPGGE